MPDFCLPAHGRVDCSLCHTGPVRFDETRATQGDWRITANPLAWGSTRPKILVLGFSKGPMQAGALSTMPHDLIAFRGGRSNLRKILAHIGLVAADANMDRLIADRSGRFAFGSLIRCTVERRLRHEGRNHNDWTGTGGGMLDRFIATPFGRAIAQQCTSRFLVSLPPETRLVVMLGLGTRLAYVDAAERLIRTARSAPGWRRYDEISYGDDQVTFVHTEHFKAQGRLLPDWLGLPRKNGSPPDPRRARLGRLAVEAVERAICRGS